MRSVLFLDSFSIMVSPNINVIDFNLPEMYRGITPKEDMRFPRLQFVSHPQLQSVEGSSKSFHHIHSDVQTLLFLKIVSPAVSKGVRKRAFSGNKHVSDTCAYEFIVLS